MIATKGSEFSLSNGDNAGVAGGVKSSTFMKESTWILYSFDVKMDGSNACRLTDKKFQNHENTADLAGEFQFPAMTGMPSAESCQYCKRAREENGTESYEEFFTQEERNEFAQIAKDFPDSENMMPPTGARYRVLDKGARAASRKQYKKAREKAKKAGEDIDKLKMDHPHPLVYGGCPVHQTMATSETAADEAADARKNAVLDKVNTRKGVS